MKANPYFLKNIQHLVLAAALLCGAASVQAVSVTTDIQVSPGGTFTPTWDSTIATNDLLLGLTPVTVTPNEANFQFEGAAGTSILTDGVSGPQFSYENTATVVDGNALVYTLPSVSILKSIVLYGAWGNNNRANLDFDVYYKASALDSDWTLLGTAAYTAPSDTYDPLVTQTTFSSLGGISVEQLRFVFRNAGSFGYNGISEIAAYAAVPEPATWAMLVGGLGMMGMVQRLRRRDR